MTVRCLFHVHSSFSYDSRTDLADIARVAKRHGFQVVLMSEHNNRLTDAQVAELVTRCDQLSDSELLIVPGLELSFDHNYVHLLAYGIRTYIDSFHEGCTFPGLVEAIHQAGGLAVLAHPSHKRAFERLAPGDFDGLDGIEIWNVKSGNQYVPNAGELALLQRLRAAGGGQVALGGVDWHHLVKFSPIAVDVDTEEVSWPALRTAVREGRYVVRGRFASVPASGSIGRGRMALYHRLGATLSRTRTAAYRLQSRIEQRGFKAPALLTSIARRWF